MANLRLQAPSQPAGKDDAGKAAPLGTARLRPSAHREAGQKLAAAAAAAEPSEGRPGKSDRAAKREATAAAAAPEAGAAPPAKRKQQAAEAKPAAAEPITSKPRRKHEKVGSVTVLMAVHDVQRTVSSHLCRCCVTIQQL